MREKLKSLQMVDLREIAKANGIKGVTTMRKEALIDRILEVTESTGRNSGEVDKQPEVRNSSDSPHTFARRMADEESKPVQRRVASKEGEENTRTESRQPVNAGIYTNESKKQVIRRANPRRDMAVDKNQSDSQHREDSRSESRIENRQDSKTDYENQTEANVTKSGKIYINPVCPVVNLDGSLSAEEEARQLQADFYDKALDSGEKACGILEVMPDGFGFIRCENYLPGENDVYVSVPQIRRFNLKTGDILDGRLKVRNSAEKFPALLYLEKVNGLSIGKAKLRTAFEELTPVFPNERLRLESGRKNTAMRIVDLISPVGKGQRGMIVAQPKAGKTTLLKEVAKSITENNPEMHMIILLIDERPEEVTDIKEAIEGENVEVIYSTFDELPDHHRRVSEMVIERAKRLVEHGQDVIILLDSITRLARAYNMVVPPSGRTLSGGLDPAALHMPKRFFGAARNMREGGSLTILATALVDTGSKMDDVVYEEFKGTGNMELVLDRKLSEKRVFPAIDIVKSGTRREDLLLDEEELEAVNIIRRAVNSMRPDDAVEKVIDLFSKTKDNREFCHMVKKIKL